MKSVSPFFGSDDYSPAADIKSYSYFRNFVRQNYRQNLCSLDFSDCHFFLLFPGMFCVKHIII